jgi:mono/diheme cytochrome c family protein
VALRSALRIGTVGRQLMLAAIALAGLHGLARADATANGAYLAAAAGCDRCHTDSEQGGSPYAGGRRLATEFGVITTPNITPDRDTGIGRWSAADFRRAMRWGIAPDNSHYVPAFPFPYYNRLTDRDLDDLKAFLDTVPPVSRPAMSRPAPPALFERARAAVAVAAMPLPGGWRDDPAKDPVWNRGAYLAATVGRCGDCHTPRNALGVPDRQRLFAGTRFGPDGKKVPNITSDRKAGIGNWTEDDIVTVLTDGHTPDFDEVGGSMVEIVKNTARLTAEDRRALAVYLLSVPAVSIAEQK